MGFLDYARSLLFEKDELKIELLTSPEVKFPQFSFDKSNYVNIFPEPKIYQKQDEEETILLMGYCFPADPLGKRQTAALFKATVSHLSAHTVISDFQVYEEWQKDKNPRLAKFATFIVEDVVANTLITEKHPERVADLAFANTLALKRLHPINRLMNPATKIMAGLLVKVNTGLIKVESEKEYSTITYLAANIEQLREKVSQSIREEKLDFHDERLSAADEIYSSIHGRGPIIEVPFLPHTEELGRCSIFSPSYLVDFDVILQKEFLVCLEHMGGSSSSFKEGENTWKKMTEAEGLQVFDSWHHRREKREKTLEKYREFLTSSRLKSVDIPRQNYKKFLDIKIGCKSKAHRLIESLLVARDAIDEDPRKMYGVLDLQEAIQVVASKSPRMDVFMLDENISKSYAWTILLDASRSMKVIEDFTLQLFIMLGEAANQLLLDPASWSMYAFNDRLLVIKDPKERYNLQIKSRIGGIKFEGFTFMPDALDIAGKILQERNENLRLITVVSDGWPYGYSTVEDNLNETINNLSRKNITIIGVGAKSQRMEDYFKNHCIVYTLRDLKKKFSNLYMEAGRIAVET